MIQLVFPIEHGILVCKSGFRFLVWTFFGQSQLKTQEVNENGLVSWLSQKKCSNQEFESTFAHQNYAIY
jgi:hypothetical protein